MVAPLGNPAYPCIAGGEILPVAGTTVPIDRGTRYDFAHTVRASAVGSITGRMTAALDAATERQQHTIAFELYTAGNQLPNDEVTTVVLPLRRVDKGATAVIIGGGTALAALSDRGGAYVEMDATLATSWVKCWFSPLALTAGTIYDWSRVVRVGLRYLAWKDDAASATPGEGFGVELVDTVLADSIQYGSWLVPDYRRSANTVIQWLGETNHLPRAVSDTWQVMPFSVTDLNHMGAADESLYVQIIAREGYDSSQTTTFLDYIEMVVEIAPERREGVASRLVTNQTMVRDLGYDSPHIVEWRWSLDPGAVIALTGGAHVATIREALPASPSDRYRAAPSGAYFWSYPEAIGPSLALMGITQARATQAPQLATDIATISGGLIVGVPASFEDYNLGSVAYDEATRVVDGPFWAAYTELLTNANFRLTYLADIIQSFTADGVTAYAGVRLMCRPDPTTTEGILVSLEKPLGTPLRSVTIPAATVRALPDVGGGWRIATGTFSSPTTPTAGSAHITAGLSNASSVWFVSGADLLGSTLYLHANDHAMLTTCALDTPPTPTVTGIAVEVDETTTCGVDTISHLALSFTVDADAYVYGLDRSIDLGATWTRIAYLLVADAVAGMIAYDDLGAPWDVEVTYRLTSYRAADQAAAQGSASTPALIASGDALIGISSASAAMVYAPGTESGGVATAWTDLSPVDYVQLAEEAAQRALRAPEDRGLALTLPVLIAALAVCTTGGEPETLTVAQRSLDPAAWDQLRVFAREARLDVRLPGGRTRVMSLALTGLIARTSAGVYLAELNLTDVHAELTNPLYA